MNRRSPLAALSILLANSAALHTAFLLLAEVGGSDWKGLMLWWGCVTLTYAALALFLRRPRPLRGVILVAVGGFLVQAMTTISLGIRYPFSLSWVCICVLWAAMYYRACAFQFRPAKAEQVIAAFEITVAVLLFTAFTVSGGITEPFTLYPLSIAILLTLLALLRLRSAHPRATEQVAGGIKGRLLLLLLLLLLGGGTAAFVLLLTGSAADLLTQFTNWLKSTGTYLLKLFERFFLWLASLFPESDMGEILPDTQGMDGLPKASAGENTIDGSFLLYLIIGVMLTAAVIALIWLWRKGGTVHLPALSRPAGLVQRKGPGLGHALTLLWRKLCRWLSYRYNYLAKYNTPPGLLIWLERQAKRRRLGRKQGETSRMFLLRLKDILPGCEDDLVRLSDCLDRLYFSSPPASMEVPVAALRRKFKRSFLPIK